MTAMDVIKSMGVTDSMIISMSGELSELTDGYEVRKTNIRYPDDAQRIDIFPKVSFSDGTCRPVYSGGWDCCKYNVSVYLNARI